MNTVLRMEPEHLGLLLLLTLLLLEGMWSWFTGKSLLRSCLRSPDDKYTWDVQANPSTVEAQRVVEAWLPAREELRGRDEDSRTPEGEV